MQLYQCDWCKQILKHDEYKYELRLEVDSGHSHTTYFNYHLCQKCSQELRIKLKEGSKYV